MMFLFIKYCIYFLFLVFLCSGIYNIVTNTVYGENCIDTD